MPPHTDDDATLVTRLSQGDPTALQQLFDRHRARLRNMIEVRMDARLRRRVDPDDVLQESFLAAESRIAHAGEHSGYVWLRLIVVQTMTDLYRRHLGSQMRDAKQEVSRAGGGYDSANLSAAFVGHLTSPTHAARRAELREQIGEILQTMQPIDREVLMLRHFEEVTNSEIAELLEITPKAASIRYVRALGRVREILERLPDFDGDSPL